MRRALVIMGDAEISNAIVCGIKSNEQQQVIPAEQHFFQSDVRKAVHYATGHRDWRSLYYGLFETYGCVEDYRQPNIIAQKLLLAWALMWDGIFEFYRRMAERNRT